MAVPIPRESRLSNFGFTFGTQYIGIKICIQTSFKLKSTVVCYKPQKMGITKNGNFFSLLRKLLAKPSCEHPPTMVFADYRSGTPLLPTMPFPGRNNSKWSWLIDVCLGVAWYTFYVGLKRRGTLQIFILLQIRIDQNLLNLFHVTIFSSLSIEGIKKLSKSHHFVLTVSR
jgi:hypothetical protein